MPSSRPETSSSRCDDDDAARAGDTDVAGVRFALSVPLPMSLPRRDGAAAETESVDESKSGG